MKKTTSTLILIIFISLFSSRVIAQSPLCPGICAQDDCSDITFPCYTTSSPPNDYPGFPTPGECLNYCEGVPIDSNSWLLIPSGISLLLLAAIFTRKQK